MISDVSASSGSGPGPVSDRTDSPYLGSINRTGCIFAPFECCFCACGIELEGWPRDYAEVVLKYLDVQELLDSSKSEPWLMAHKELDVD